MTADPQAPIYLVDGFAIIFKNYYAMIRSPLVNLRGENVSALLGFVKQIQQILRHAREQGSRHMAVLLDSGCATFRHEIYPEYKANRDEAPEDLSLQIGYLAKLLELWGIPAYKSPGYEADDLIATLARRASAADHDCFIVSGDKDLYQLIDQRVQILKPDKGRIEQHGSDYARKKWGVSPEQMRDYLALVGDSADNIPGVRGIGPKGAAKLLADYQNLDNIYAHLAEIKPDSTRRKLGESKENAFLSYQLVGLADQLEARVLQQPSWEALWQALELPDKVYGGQFAEGADRGEGNPEFARFLAELGLNQLARDFGLEDTAELGGNNTTTEAPSPLKSGNAGLSQQRALTPPALRSSRTKAPGNGPQMTSTEVLQGYECVTTGARLQEWCQRITRGKIVAIDTETTGLNELADELVGISLATDRHRACYIPLRIDTRCREVAGQTDVNPVPRLLSATQVREALAACLDPEVKVIGQNFKFDYKVLASWGLKVPNVYFDTMIAAWLLDSLHPVGMDALAARYLNLEPIHFKDLLAQATRAAKDELTGPYAAKAKIKSSQMKATFAEVPLEQATRYAAEDADITWQLYQCLEPLLRERGLEQLFFELEMPLVRILGEMELWGIGCNRTELQKYATELEGEISRLETKVRALTGADFNLNSPRQLAEVLFEKLGLPSDKRNKTGYSTDNSILENLRDQHPAIAPLLEYRSLSKLHSTYVKALPEMVLARTRRIHTHFSVIGAETGRLSCKDPNLQNIPVKDSAGRRIRNAFQPEAGWGFLSADYSQIELVVLAHLSGDPGLCRAFQAGRDIHQQTASQLFHLPPDQVSAEQRRIAKSINFGVIYGMSAFRLARDLGLRRKDAQSFIEAYFHEFSGVKSFISHTVAQAAEQGYVETLLGRHREIRQLRSNNHNERSHGERMAVNTVVQGSAADIVKRAMILLDAELARKHSEADWKSRMLLQVHDELIFEAPLAEREALESLVLDVMENAEELDVPLKVNGEWSERSWGELH